MSKNLKLIAIIGLIAAASIAYFAWKTYHKPHDDLYKKSVDVTVEMEFFLLQYDENEALADSLYLGKLIEWTAPVNEILEGNDGVSLFFTDSQSNGLMAELDTLVKKDLPVVGEMVTVRGICSGKLIDVVVSRCVIL